MVKTSGKPFLVPNIPAAGGELGKVHYYQLEYSRTMEMPRCRAESGDYDITQVNSKK